MLLDHNAPRNLVRYLVGHELRHTSELGWCEFTNGELLKTAEANGFQILITADKGIAHQQNPSTRNVAVLCLSTNNWRVMKPHVSALAEAVEQVKLGEVRPFSLARLFVGGSRSGSDGVFVSRDQSSG
jgi:predicted nuclease of predicted toxin-antitoxin system